VARSIITTHGTSLPFSLFFFQEANREYAEFFKELAKAVGGSVAVEACVPRPPSPVITLGTAPALCSNARCCCRYEREESASPPLPPSPVGFALQVRTSYQFS
jgi:hypothetical protein